MQRSTIVITSADQAYFSFAQGCLRSIRDNPLADTIALAFFDIGCTRQQRSWIDRHVDSVIEPNWHFGLESSKGLPGYLRGVLARPFLREYFAGFETYVWLDADAWLQDWQAFGCLIQGAASRKGIAIVPEIDRGSLRQYGGLPEYWKLAYRWYAGFFGEETAGRLCSYPMLNAGVFGLHCDAPHWQAWEQALTFALRSSKCTMMTDQLALNYVVYQQGLFADTELLPAWCNWTCHNGLPTWDEQRQLLVEPYVPHTPIGICHLTTRNKNPLQQLRTIDGQPIQVRITYPPQATQSR